MALIRCTLPASDLTHPLPPPSPSFSLFHVTSRSFSPRVSAVSYTVSTLYTHSHLPRSPCCLPTNSSCVVRFSLSERNIPSTFNHTLAGSGMLATLVDPRASQLFRLFAIVASNDCASLHGIRVNAIPGAQFLPALSLFSDLRHAIFFVSSSFLFFFVSLFFFHSLLVVKLTRFANPWFRSGDTVQVIATYCGLFGIDNAKINILSLQNILKYSIIYYLKYSK